VAQHTRTCASCLRELEELEAALAVVAEPVASAHGPRQGAREEIWGKIGRELDTHPEPEADAPRVELSIALVCSFCKGVLPRREACYCASCLAPHHDECWALHGRCSALGCDETRTVRPGSDVPQVARPRRLRRFGLPVILLAVGGAAGAVAARRPSSLPAPVQVAGTAPETTRRPIPVTPPEVVPVPETPEDKTGKEIRRFLEGAPPVEPEAKKGVIKIDLSVHGSKPEAATVGSHTVDRTKIDIACEEAELRDVVATIGSRVGRPILVDSDVHEKVSIALRQIPWRDALDVLARMHKCDIDTIGSETLVFTQAPKVTIQFHQANVRVVLQLLAAYSGKNIVIAPSCPSTELSVDFHEVNWLKALRSILKTFHVHAVLHGSIIVVLPGDGPDLPDDATQAVLRDSDEPYPHPELRLDMSLEDADLREVMDEVGRRVRANIIVEPDIHEKVTVDLEGVPWHDALVVIARLTRCEIEKKGSVWVLTQAPKVTLQATDTPAAVWFQLLAKYAGKNNVIAAPDVTGEITCDLHEAHWVDAIKATALAYGYDLAEDPGDILRIQMPRRGK
ncbi:MAG TPA: hypothetical protein VFF73_11755, partial [Planctomycetota bacterium]|nr:hypothetical protein [Planctomycetota bacterium]